MKTNVVFYLLMLLILSSCDSSNFDEEVPNAYASVPTDSEGHPLEIARFNTLLQDIEFTNSIAGPYPCGITKMSGNIYTFSEGVEYDLCLWGEVHGDKIKCIFWAIGSGEIIKDGKHYQSISVESGKQVRFKYRFRSNKTSFRLAIEADNLVSQYRTASARLVLEGRRYNGQSIMGHQEGDYDLNVSARFPDNPNMIGGGISDTHHWVCGKCAAIYSIHAPECFNCDIPRPK